MMNDISDKSLEQDKRGKVHKCLLYVKCFGPFFISHHPECEKFGKSHTINIGKYHFCIGCFVGYTAAFLSIFIISFIGLENTIPLHYFLIVSIIFIGSFILSPLNLTKIKTIKIFQKMLIGIGAATLLVYIRNLPNSSITNRIIIMIVFMFLISLLNGYHTISFLKTCYDCETPFDWGHCSGFKSITTSMEKYNLKNILLELDGLSKKILKKRKHKQSKKNR